MPIKITPELLANLWQKAEAAGGRSWEVQDRRRSMRSPHYHIAVVDDYWQDEAELLIAETIGGKGQKVWANANHIAAASPAVILAIIDEIKRLNERFDEQKLLATRMIEHAAEQKKEIERLRNRLDALECPNCGNQPKFCMCEVEQPEASQ